MASKKHEIQLRSGAKLDVELWEKSFRIGVGPTIFTGLKPELAVIQAHAQAIEDAIILRVRKAHARELARLVYETVGKVSV